MMTEAILVLLSGICIALAHQKQARGTANVKMHTGLSCVAPNDALLILERTANVTIMTCRTVDL